MRLQSPPLFWRTFLLIVLLSVASLAAWVPMVSVVERVPRAHQLAARLVSLVNATRIALVYSDPAQRREMLGDLLENEGLHVVPLEASDRVKPFENSALMALVEQEVRQRLGPGTRLASEVNGASGFWISFAIDDDGYWVYLNRDLLHRDIGNAWIAWALLATVLSLLVAIAITRVVNRPLAGLSLATTELGAGRTPAPLPDDRGPPEIRTVNRNFNRMVSDLEKLNQDRAVLLAGVSHDLRTPLTRLRLELEMSALPDAARTAMIGDLEQMDEIVRQFLDYAMPAPQRPAEVLDLSALVAEALARNRLHSPAQRLQTDIREHIFIRGYRTELLRALDNLIGNAMRYGCDAQGHLDLTVTLREQLGGAQDNGGRIAVLELADRGPGIAAAHIERLVRPFERGDAARTGSAGAGLGLAIVERALRMNAAQIRYGANEPSGLKVSIRLPSVREDG